MAIHSQAVGQERQKDEVADELQTEADNLTDSAPVSPSGTAAPAADMPSAAAGAPENKAPQRHHKNHAGARSRIAELLSQVKMARLECASLRDEARAAMAKASEKIEQLKGEVLAARQEVNDLQAREDVRRADEDALRQNAERIEAEHRAHCLVILIGAAHKEQFYGQHPDFETRLKRFNSPQFTRLLTEICTFPAQIIAQMAYAIASNEPVMKKLAALANELPWACVRWLVRISMDFENDVRVRQIQQRLMAWR